MSKRTSAKAYFEAQGRSAASRGLPINLMRARRQSWPQWAREAWARGWIQQKDHPARRTYVETYLQGPSYG